MKLGSERLREEFVGLGYSPSTIEPKPGQVYLVLPDFEVASGAFAAKIVDLAFLCPPDYPRGGFSSIHVRAVPALVAIGRSKGRNVMASDLGPDWQYWSFNIPWDPNTRDAKHLIRTVHAIFDRLQP